MKKQKGFTLIEILVIIAVLIITAAGGVVVWEKKVIPTPTFTPILTVTPAPKLGLSPIPSPEVSPTPVFKEKLPFEVKACQKDEDCSFVYAPHCLGECLPCEIIDISDASMVAVNWEQCIELSKIYIKEKVQRLGHVLGCPGCAQPSTNKNNFQAKCINNICTKTQ